MKLFGCCDLALDPMTFTSDHDLDMVVTYLHAKNLVNRSSSSKVIIQIHTLLAAVTLTLVLILDLAMVVTYLHAKN